MIFSNLEEMEMVCKEDRLIKLAEDNQTDEIHFRIGDFVVLEGRRYSESVFFQGVNVRFTPTVKEGTVLVRKDGKLVEVDISE